MARNHISTTVYLSLEQHRQLRELSTRTKVPFAEYIRQAIDLFLKEKK